MSDPSALARRSFPSAKQVFANGSAPTLIEAALVRKEGMLTDLGALTAFTGKRTGRSPYDKYIVKEPGIAESVDWGTVNQPMSRDMFDRLLPKAWEHIQEREVFVHDGYACADPRSALTIRVIAEKAWHALFARCLFRRYDPQVQYREAEWLILAVPELRFDPVRDGTHSEAAIVVSFADRIVLIAGTHYAGEIKKSIFTILNALLPLKGVFSMHCSANIGEAGDVALFFGLSGTGKTTLSADPGRRLIGDDEHGWSDEGVFNIEGGCYAKTIRLSPTGEPQIWNAIRFGAVLENVPLDPLTRVPDFNSTQYTENTRVAYPLEHIPGVEMSGRGAHPSNIFFLTCDVFGVLPPVSLLSPEQAMEHFLLGYTAKVAGTETGIKEPQAIFSPCFGAPFMPLAPRRYAELLKQRLEKFQVPVWLINTGWSGGGYGVGRRMSLDYTRAILRAALDGSLRIGAFVNDPIFQLQVPATCNGVPAEVLQPRKTWSDATAYDAVANKLVAMFRNPTTIEK